MSRLLRWVVPDRIAPSTTDRLFRVWDEAIMGVKYLRPLLIAKGMLHR